PLRWGGHPRRCAGAPRGKRRAGAGRRSGGARPRGDRGRALAQRRGAGAGGAGAGAVPAGAVPAPGPAGHPARLMARAWRLPLSVAVTAVALAYMAIAAALALLLEQWLGQRWLALPIAIVLPLPLLLYHVRRLLAPAHSLFRALAG